MGARPSLPNLPLVVPADLPQSPLPRKRRRWPWILLGLVLGGCGMLALLLAPPIQAWLVRRAVGLQPGWRVDFAKLSATPSGVELDGLDFAMPGLNARSAPIAVRLAPGRLFNKRELKIERVEARKLRITLTPAEFVASAATPAREPFTGLFALLQSPLAWALDEAQLEAEIAVRDAGQSLVVGSLSISGGGLSSERAGEFTYELSINSALLPPGPDNHVRSRGKIRLTQGPAHNLVAIAIEGEIALPRYGRLTLPAGKFTLTAAAAPVGETYRLRLDLGTAGTIEFNGTLEAALAKLTARATARGDQSLLASLLGDKLPAATLDATADLALDLRRNDLDVTLTGNLDASRFAALAPELATLPAAKGTLAAALTRRSGKFSVTRLDADLRAANARLAFALTQPLDPLALPTTPLATVTLDKLPLAWANPWLFPHGLALDPADLNGAWQITLSPQRDALTLVPTRPVEIAAVSVKGAKLPVLPPIDLSFRPQATVSTSRAALQLENFAATTARGDRLSSRLTGSYDFKTGRVETTGRISGTAPTLLAGPDQAAPFTLTARWDAALAGTALNLKSLEFVARLRRDAPPWISLQLLRPLDLDLANLTTPQAPATTDWARLQFSGFPLGWVSRWMPGRDFAGTIAAGESWVRSTPDGKLSFETTTPWRLADAAFGLGGKNLFAGEATIAPSASVHADRCTADIREISATHRDGSRIYGSITANAHLHDKKASTAVELYAELPALPHSEQTFGPLYAALRAKSHNETPTIAVVDEFSLRVLSRDREVFLLEAPAPFVAGLSAAGFVSAGTTTPLKLTTGEVPLAWLRPWLPDLEADGILQPAEFHLTAELTKFRLRPIKPVHIRNFSARIANRDVARAMDFSFYPGADLTLICIPTPVFQLAYNGAAHLTNGAIDVAGQRAIDLDVSVGFVGNDERIFPSSLDYTTRADFAQLSRVPALTGTGFPVRGTFVARANGDLLGKSPLELWCRLEGIPSADTQRSLAPLELTARGKFSPADQSLIADVALNLETKPRATDATFDAKLNLNAGRLEFASRFRSQFFDAAEAFAFIDAIQSSRTSSSPTTESPSSFNSQLSTFNSAPPRGASEPLWSQLRGHFDLDLGTVRFAPYQIDRVRGRLDLRDREFVLSDLNGEMFAGRWRGNARVDYDPENKTADHTFAAGFHIEQFDSARIVQTIFPTELASVDAKIDVHSSLFSRGSTIQQLIDRAEADFTAEGRQGLVRLNVPKQDTAATAAVFGGAVLLSPELRALGRLLKKFAEMPVDHLRIAGARQEDGDVLLTEFRLDSPQARLLAHGQIPAVAGTDLLNRPLELSVDLAAKDEMAVILGGMSLIEKKPRPDGYRPLKEKFELRGKAGAPDTRPLYDLLAKAVLGSKGTWGFLMRKVQDQLTKAKTTSAVKPGAASAP